MLSNASKNNAVYDSFFLEHTFNSPAMLAFSQKEIMWLTQELNLPKTSTIIDVACGSGRHLKAFFDQGYNPTGLDISPDCIRFAKQNCPAIEDSIHQTDFLRFVDKNPPEFDVVFTAGASFGYDSSLEVNLKHFSALLNLVNPNGYLVIQYLNRIWAHSFVKDKITFWHEDAEKFTLDKREVDGVLLKSEKIFIKKNEHFQKKYSDVIYCFSDEEILQNAKNLSPDRHFQKILLNDSFSSTKYNESTSATPVLILKRIP